MRLAVTILALVCGQQEGICRKKNNITITKSINKNTSTTTFTPTTIPTTSSSAVVYPQVNGLWVKQNETNGEKPVFKHSLTSLFLHADMRPCCHGNWHISSAIQGGNVFYWAAKTAKIPLKKRVFNIVPYSKETELFIIEESSGDSITLSHADGYPQVNGLWVKQNETNGGKDVFKHSTKSLFLYADTRSCCHGNWHINSAIQGGYEFYWAKKMAKIPLGKVRFNIGGESKLNSKTSHQISKLVITVKKLPDLQCRHGWSTLSGTQTCFKLFTPDRFPTFDDAKNDCTLMNSHLVRIDSVAANQQISQSAFGGIWISATDMGHEGQWTDIFENPLNFSNWSPNQPDNFSNQQHCGWTNFDKVGDWDDIGCNYSGDRIHHYACQYGKTNDADKAYTRLGDGPRLFICLLCTVFVFSICFSSIYSNNYLQHQPYALHN